MEIQNASAVKGMQTQKTAAKLRRRNGGNHAGSGKSDAVGGFQMLLGTMQTQAGVQNSRSRVDASETAGKQNGKGTAAVSGTAEGISRQKLTQSDQSDRVHAGNDWKGGAAWNTAVNDSTTSQADVKEAASGTGTAAETKAAGAEQETSKGATETAAIRNDDKKEAEALKAGRSSETEATAAESGTGTAAAETRAETTVTEAGAEETAATKSGTETAATKAETETSASSLGTKNDAVKTGQEAPAEAVTIRDGNELETAEAASEPNSEMVSPENVSGTEVDRDRNPIQADLDTAAEKSADQTADGTTSGRDLVTAGQEGREVRTETSADSAHTETAAMNINLEAGAEHTANSDFVTRTAGNPGIGTEKTANPETNPDAGNENVVTQDTGTAEAHTEREPSLDSRNGLQADASDVSAKTKDIDTQTEISSREATSRKTKAGNKDAGSPASDTERPNVETDRSGLYFQTDATSVRLENGIINNKTAVENSYGKVFHPVTLQTSSQKLPEDISSFLAANMKDKSGSVEITLRPENLGNLTIRVSRDGEHTRFLILADRPDTMQLLRSHAAEMGQMIRKATGEETIISVPEREETDRRAMDTDTEGRSQNRREQNENKKRQEKQSGHDRFLNMMRLGIAD